MGAHEADDIPYIELLTDYWGELCASKELASDWADRLVGITRIMGFQFPAQIGPPWKAVQTPEGGSLKADFERLAQLPFSHIVGGHGGLLRNDGQARFAETMTRVFG